MILNWFKSKKSFIRAEPTALDSEGEMLREIDDVMLIRDIETDTVPEELQFFRGTIPENSVATVITIETVSENPIGLEFNLAGKLAFAHTTGSNLRLHMRREEKLKHA